MTDLLRCWEVVGSTLGGLVAGEGSFYVTREARPFRDGTPRQRFVFQVTMAERDRDLLEGLRAFLGVGSIRDRRPQRPAWQPASTFTVSSRRAHRTATIPFGQRFLLPGAKRRQFERWRDEFSAYESEHPTRYGSGPSPCAVPGCDRPVRGRGLCRSHYHRATGY